MASLWAAGYGLSYKEEYMRQTTKICIRTAILVTLLLFFLLGCEQPPDNPTTPIFSNVFKIQLVSPDDGGTIGEADRLRFELPTEVEYAVLMLFDGPIDVNDDEKTISTTNLEGGLRTGLSGFSRSYAEIASLLRPEADFEDFKSEFIKDSEDGDVTYCWVVIGYNSSGIITHASPEWTVTITWLP